MKATIKLEGNNEFDIEFAAEERATVLKMFSLWLNSIASSANDALKLDALIQKLRKQSSGLASVVSAVGGTHAPDNPPNPPPDEPGEEGE